MSQGATSSGWPARPGGSLQPNLATCSASRVDGINGVQIGPGAGLAVLVLWRLLLGLVRHGGLAMNVWIHRFSARGMPLRSTVAWVAVPRACHEARRLLLWGKDSHR